MRNGGGASERASEQTALPTEEAKRMHVDASVRREKHPGTNHDTTKALLPDGVARR